MTDGDLQAREIRHPVSEKDAAAVAALRLQVASLKGKLSGIDARGAFDDMMELSPLYASLCSQTPVQLHVGTTEVLLDDSRRYAKRLRDARREAAVRVWEDMMHVFPSSAGMLEASDAAVITMSAFLEEKLGVKAR